MSAPDKRMTFGAGDITLDKKCIGEIGGNGGAVGSERLILELDIFTYLIMITIALIMYMWGEQLEGHI